MSDRREQRRAWAGESLPPGGDALVRSIFGDEVLGAPPHRVAYGVRGAWGSDELIDTDFVAHPRGEGWHLDREVFDSALEQVALERGVEVVRRRVVDVRREAGSGDWSVTDVSGHCVRTRWVVDATGRTGFVSGRLEVDRIEHDRQRALIAIVPDRAGGPATTVIEAERDGWWYCTPLPGDRLVVALLTDDDLVPAVEHRTEWWRTKLARTRHISTSTGAIPPDLAPRLTRAETTSRVDLHGDHWVAVGDAAMSWDPLSSQGLMTGMLMGARAGRVIGDRDHTASSEALEQWARDYRMILEEHLSLRNHYWDAERRWSDSTYWSRRH